VAILEVFLLNDAVQELVSRHAMNSELRETAQRSGMRTLRDAGWEKVSDGLTTIEEVTRITSNLQLSYVVQNDDEADG
jgi:type II secretory ATPase GspE/PulE/Tfp pilus assembly ATPase PilB-like protein